MKLNTNYIDRMLNVTLAPIIFEEFFFTDLFIHGTPEEKLNKIYPILDKECSVYNLDEINLLFEKNYPTYLYNQIKECPEKYYLKILEKISESFLTHRDGEITFKYWESEKDYFKPYKNIEKILVWSSLNRIIPTDILGILFLLKNNQTEIFCLNGYHSNISLADKQLDHILKKGISETHLHASAATDFYNSWKNIMNFNVEYNFIKQKTNCYEKIIEKRIELTKIYRILMGEYLVYFAQKQSRANFQEYLEEICKDINSSLLRKIIQEVELREEVIVLTEELKNIFKCLKERILKKKLIKEEEINLNKDILEYIDKIGANLDTNIENVFLMHSLKHIKSKECSTLFLKMFFRYLKSKNILFKLMVHNSKIKGLENFKSYYLVSTTFGKDNYEVCWRERLRNQFKDKNLKKIEFRIAPEKNAKKMLENIKNILFEYKMFLEKEYKNQKIYYNFPTIGIIYHFMKKKDNIEKCWYKFQNERHNFNHFYYENLKKSYTKSIDNIIKIRSEIGNLSKYIVGIDAASVENNTEPWVFAPIYDEIRNSDNGYRDKKGNKIKSLGFSFHVGEEFRHILTGLRRVDEVIKHFKYHSGDRIGHGIALGIDIYEWCKNHPIIILPRIEQLENLIWIWEKIRDTHILTNKMILEKEIYILLKEIYGNIEGITLENFLEVYNSKFMRKNFENENFKNFVKCKVDEGVVNYSNILCLNSKVKQEWTVELLKKSFDCKKYLLKMNEPIQIKIDKENIELYKELQIFLLKNIVREGIVVETNPTSNLVIGEIKNIFEHYILNLNQLKTPLNEAKEEYRYLMVSINSDDPSVFNTTLSNEFAYIYYALLNEGYSKELVLNWMDKIREYGLNTSFISERRENVCDIILEINRILKEIELHIAIVK